MKLYEMEGFLRGKCLPGDMLVNETNAQYLVRKFTELHDRIEVTAAALREKTKQCEQMAAENVALEDAISSVFPDGVEDEPGMIGFTATAKKAFYALNETPATDSFLAEVRAQGVEMLAEKLREHIAVDSSGSTRARALTRIVDIVSDQLRKGVQS
ncbi:hypothetical protein [Kosakonia cowanii]|uniref:hypothetical protein n=1 Tax=Kosakonia cowanii TaxID=208223 RepID=UPI002899FCE5|nr:hypothetical protein [Kosakonia cowanii]